MTRDLRVLIVDDEPLARRGMRQLLAGRADCLVVGEARNGREALQFLDTVRPDVVLLDVQMPEMDGFEVIRARGYERMPPVVFVTAYDAYAVRAFDTHAVDYLVKPVSATRFNAALERVRERLTNKHSAALAERLRQLLESVEAVQPGGRIVVPTRSGELVLNVSEIDWIAASDYYAELHVNGKRYLLRESMDSLEQRLETRHFVRVHRSAIVNVARVRELRTGDGSACVVLRDGSEVPVSRRRREAIAAALRAT